jgi:VWFA-related protein
VTFPFEFRRFRPLVAIALGALYFAGPGRGWEQSAPPATPTAAAANVPNSPQQEGDSGIATIRTYSNLVVVDVVVTDSQGNPVHGLPRDTFALTENGKPQTLRHFEEHSASPVLDIKVLPPPRMPPGLFSNRTPAFANGPVNVLLLDYLNTPVSVQPYARKQLLDYLDHAAPGTRIAIFGLTTQLSMLQGFTSDMTVLKNALDPKKGGAAQVSQLLANSVTGGPTGDTSLSQSLLASDATSTDITQEMVDAVTRFEAMQSSFQTDMRVQYTLNGIDSLARYLIGIPGRKNVIWYSGSFPLDVQPDPNEEDPNDSVVRNDELVRETDNLLTRAQVAMYPVDARGLQTDPSQNFFNEATNPAIGGSSGQDAATSSAAFLQQTAQEQLTMQAMAEDTGGQAYVNSSGLTQAVQKAIANGSNYYTLTYSPTNQAWDGRFRTIKVKVDQPGVKLHYRIGYFAIDPNDRNKLYAQQAAAIQTQPTTMITAMMHGGPDPAQILFKVRIRPAATPPEETPLKSNQANPDPKVKLEGPFKSYGVDLVPDPHAVSCKQEPNGNRHCALEMWTFVYNTDGQKLITASNRVHTMLTPADYAQLLTGGIAFHQEISVPVKGQYFIRTAIHDMVSDQVGAVEIPISAVARLTPLKTIASSSGPEPSGPVLQDLSGAPRGTAPAPAAPAPPPQAAPSGTPAQPQ